MSDKITMHVTRDESDDGAAIPSHGLWLSPAPQKTEGNWWFAGGMQVCKFSHLNRTALSPIVNHDLCLPPPGGMFSIDIEHSALVAWLLSQGEVGA